MKRTRMWLALVWLALWGSALARFEWRDVVQQVEILPDGDVLVTDERTLWTDEDFGEAFICVELEPGQTLSLLEGSSLSLSGATYYQQDCESGARGQEIVVSHPERIQEGRVRFYYRLEGAVEAYSDVAQWYWQILEREHPPIVGYEVTVTAPGPMSEPYDAYVHRFGNPEEPTVVLSDDQSTLQVGFERIPDGNGVEIRYLMDPALFTLQGSEPGFEQALLDESRIANLNNPSKPNLTLEQSSTTVDRASVAISGIAIDTEGVGEVNFSLNQNLYEPCEGTTSFTCQISSLAVGVNTITIAADDINGISAFETIEVHRRSFSERVRSSPLWGLLALAILLFLLQGVWRAYQKFGREPDTGATMKYPFEPPSDLPPAAVTVLSSQRSPGMSQAFHATIMDLARRGYGEFNGKERKFEMTLDSGRSLEGLEPFEASVLSYLRTAAKSGRKGEGFLGLQQREQSNLEKAHLDFDELKTYSQQNLSSFMNRWTSEVKEWTEARFGGPLTSAESRRAAGSWFALCFLGAALCFGLQWFTFGPAKAIFIVGAVLCGLLGIVAALVLPSWRKDLAPEIYGWQGFKRTLSDYTQMKDAPDDFFKLWDRYYVYAAALGVAQRFLKNLERAAPLRNLDESSMARQASWMGSSANLSSLGSLSSSISSLSSALSAASASASSGGSSGGGGGGGGGGSSGGR